MDTTHKLELERDLLRGLGVKLPEPTNRATAKQQAARLATGLKSKPVSFRQVRLGEPEWHYKIPLHVNEFWFKVLVSDEFCLLEGEHRRRDAFSFEFCAAIKTPDRVGNTTQHLMAVSATLGFNVYTLPQCSEQFITDTLLSPAIRTILTQLDCRPLRGLYLNSVQICALCELSDPETVVTQIELYRSLLLKVFAQTVQDEG
jgi:hypothetical protein